MDSGRKRFSDLSTPECVLQPAFITSPQGLGLGSLLNRIAAGKFTDCSGEPRDVPMVIILAAPIDPLSRSEQL